MQELVAVDLPGGAGFIEALRRIWDAGDAILPIDRRLPPAARRRLLDATRPHRVIDDGGEHRLDTASPPLDAGDALLIASSGTTGEPKLIVHSLDGLRAHARAVHRHLGVGADDRWMACLPLAHIGGLGVVLRSILDDVPVDAIDGFDAELVASAPRRLGSTLVSLVPTALDRIDAGAYRWVVLGGSGDARERPANVVRTYGSTETGGGIVYDHRPLPGVEIRIDGGEILVRSPSLARGIRTRDGAIRSIADADGWYRTGDLGRLATDGDDAHLVVDGRADDLIVTGGQNVWPQPIETLLMSLPTVHEAAVFGRADPEWGQRVVAALVLAGAAPSRADIEALIRAELPAYAVPKEIVVVDSLPRTALGKIRRRELI